MPGDPRRKQLRNLDAGKFAVILLLFLVLGSLLVARAWPFTPIAP
jgi:hypothetical protein